MVRAILDGRKTMTRRIIKPQPIENENGGWSWEGRNGGFIGAAGTHIEEGFPQSAAYWSRFRPGDRLWVREAWRTLHKWDDLAPRHLADDISKITYEADPERRNPLWCFGKLRPGMFMPRWASRLTLYVAASRAERLQDISEEDARAEGIHRIECLPSGRFEFHVYEKGTNSVTTSDPVDSYRSLWDAINGPGAWDANPWVSVTTFVPRLGNIDTLPATLAEAA